MTSRFVFTALLGLSACAPGADVAVCPASDPGAIQWQDADGAQALLDDGWLPAAACDAAAVEPKSSSSTVTLSGNAFVFGSPGLRLPYATVTVDEVPGAYAVTDAAGAWSISGLPANTDLTPKITFPNALYTSIGLPAFQEMYQQTFRDHADTDIILFQSVPESTFAALGALAGITPDPAACQVVTTVAVPEMGEIASIDEYFSPHGLSGVTTVLVPTSGAPSAVYFNDSVLPDPTRTETSGDGGVLWGNVEAGKRYKIKATDTQGVYSFNQVWVSCEAGRFINASPPRSVVAE
ncbi:MAG: hypothetical protein H6740_25905 [Alphaproteobacteria bacterium]|nr:hypothetical protein [Alphaproteobacteria bacterium]